MLALGCFARKFKIISDAQNAGIKKLREHFDLQKYIAHVESEEFRPGRKKKQV